jgi:hypothetical protein
MKSKLHIYGAGKHGGSGLFGTPEQKMGFSVRYENPVSDHETWIAKSDTAILSADDVVTLLGLATLAESRGEGWQASDAEIQDFLKKFGYERPVA